MNFNLENIQNILPLLNGQGQDMTQILNLIGQNNPNVASLMQLLPLIQQNTPINTPAKNNKKNFDKIVKVDDFYKHKSY